jgi:hypothetical protein
LEREDVKRADIPLARLLAQDADMWYMNAGHDIELFPEDLRIQEYPS